MKRNKQYSDYRYGDFVFDISNYEYQIQTFNQNKRIPRKQLGYYPHSLKRTDVELYEDYFDGITTKLEILEEIDISESWEYDNDVRKHPIY